MPSDHYRTDLAWADVVLNTASMIPGSVPALIPVTREGLDGWLRVSSQWTYDSQISLVRRTGSTDAHQTSGPGVVDGSTEVTVTLLPHTDTPSRNMVDATLELFVPSSNQNLYVCLFTVNGYRIGVMDVAPGDAVGVSTDEERRMQAFRSVLRHQGLLSPFFGRENDASRPTESCEDTEEWERLPSDPVACGHMVDNLLRFVADPGGWYNNPNAVGYDHQTLARIALRRVFMGTTAQTAHVFSRMAIFLATDEQTAALSAGWGTVNQAQISWLSTAISSVSKLTGKPLLNASWDYLRTMYEWGWYPAQVIRLLLKWLDATDGETDFALWVGVPQLIRHGFTGVQVGLLADANIHGDEAVHLDDAGQLDWDSVRLLAALNSQ